MAWVAVDKNGNESVFINKPVRCRGFWWDEIELKGACYSYYDSEVGLPKGSIRKLIGRDLTWKDEPVELKEE